MIIEHTDTTLSVFSAREALGKIINNFQANFIRSTENISKNIKFIDGQIQNSLEGMSHAYLERHHLILKLFGGQLATLAISFQRHPTIFFLNVARWMRLTLIELSNGIV